MRKFKILSLFILVVVVLNLSVLTPDADDHENWSPKLVGGFGYFSVGIQNLDLNNLNYRLQRNGYESFSSEPLIFGGGGFGVINKLIIGGEGFGIIEEEVISPNGLYKQKFSAGYGLFKIGYIFYSNTQRNFYGLFGIGGGGIQLKIIQNTIPNFQGIFENPMRSSFLSNSFFMFNVGLGYTQFFKFNKEKGQAAGFLMGLEIGYNFSIPENTWLIDVKEIGDGPKVGITGLYFRVNYGGGVLIKK